MKNKFLSRFESLSIKKKYLAAVFVIAISFLFIILFSLIGIRAYEKSNESLMKAVEKSNLINEIRSEMSEIHNGLSLQLIDGEKRTLLLEYDKTLLQKWFKKSSSCQDETINCDHFKELWKEYLKSSKEIYNNYKSVDHTLPEYLASNHNDIYKIRIGTVNSKIKDNSLFIWLQKVQASGGGDPAMRFFFNPLLELFQKAVHHEKTGDRDALNAQLNKLLSSIDDAKLGIQDLFEINEKYALIFKNRLGEVYNEIVQMFSEASTRELESLQETRKTLKTKGDFLTFLLFVVAGLSSALIILMFYLLILTTVNPVMNMRLRLEELSKRGGDLSESLAVISGDEIGSMTISLNNFFGDLRNIVRSVKISTEELNSISRSISNGTSDASIHISQTSSYTEDISHRLSETAGNLSNTAKSMENLNIIITDVSKKSDASNKLLMSALESMNDIHDASLKIQNVNDVLNEIAFQTNILSLNAAIEAARAGEYGKGFAVVADEVRELSKKSSDGALQIKRLINDASKKIESGAELVKNSADFFLEILNEFRNIFNEISCLSSELRNNSVRVEQIDQAVESIKYTLNNNAAFIEEMAAASKDMADYANLLHKEVERFKV